MQSPRHFRTTCWTMVLHAADFSSPMRQQALTEMLGQYWYPLYGYIRRQGYPTHQAEDLVQSFIARLLEKDTLKGIEQGRGRFRNFLLVCLRRFLANEAERAGAQIRGGHLSTLSFDFENADARFQREPGHELTPQRLFDRDWALQILEQTLQHLAESWKMAGKQSLFESLRPHLVDHRIATTGSETYAQTAARIGMSEGAVKTAVHRLRNQFRQTLCDQVAATLNRGELLEDEIRRLFSALRV